MCSGLGALVMAQLTLALVVDAFTAEAPSFVIPVFGTLTLFEAISCYVARLDASIVARGSAGPSLRWSA